jgi:hypothetical protein
MDDVKRSVAKGTDLKRKEHTGSFRVISQGEACILILQTRKKQ